MIPFPFLASLWWSKPFRWAAGGFIVVTAYNIWIWQHDRKVSERAVMKIDTQAKELTKQAVKAREPASQPGSAERLKARYCVDCTNKSQ